MKSSIPRRGPLLCVAAAFTLAITCGLLGVALRDLTNSLGFLAGPLVLGMSQFVATPTKTYKASAAISKYHRVKIDSNGKLAEAGAGEVGIGILENESFADGDPRAARLWSMEGTFKMVAGVAISQYATVYPAASGKVSDVGVGAPLGLALEASSADGDVIEVLPMVEQNLDASFTIGSESSDTINVAIQVTDAAGNDVSHRVPLTIYLLDDANGDAFNTDTYSSVAVGTDGAIAETLASKVYEAITESDGDLDIDFTITGAATTHVAVKLPGRSDLVISDAVTHAA